MELTAAYFLFHSNWSSLRTAPTQAAKLHHLRRWVRDLTMFRIEYRERVSVLNTQINLMCQREKERRPWACRCEDDPYCPCALEQHAHPECLVAYLNLTTERKLLQRELRQLDLHYIRVVRLTAQLEQPRLPLVHGRNFFFKNLNTLRHFAQFYNTAGSCNHA